MDDDPPPPPWHRPTHAELTPAPVNILRDHSGPIDIGRLRIPFMVAVAAAAFIIGTLTSAVTVWVTMSNHANNHIVHLDEKAVTEGGGPAMKNDVAAVRNEMKWGFSDSQKQTRRTLRRLKIVCRRAGAGMDCSVETQDDD